MRVNPNLESLLRPRSIAVVGASDQEGSFGQRLLSAIGGWRWDGAVYPINPRRTRVHGLPCFPSLADLPAAVDLVAFAIGDDRVEAALAEAAAAGARAAVIFGRCFEPITPGRPALAERLGAVARESGMALCGCNCMGFINTLDGLKVTGNPPPVRDRLGRVALLSHSGSSWSGLVGNQRQLDFSFAVSVGQEVSVTMADYLDFLVDRPETRAIGCIIETVRDSQGFVAVLERADRRGVPVAVLKLGRSERAREFAVAHSGAVSGVDSAYQAVFDRHHVSRCQTIDELADTLELLSCGRVAGPGGFGAVTDSGGERQLLVDVAAVTGCPIPELRPGSLVALTKVLDPGMTPENPVDCYGDGRLLYRECLEIVAGDPDIAVAGLSTNLVHGRPRTLNAAQEAVTAVHKVSEKPVLVISNVSSAVDAGTAERLRDEGIPVLLGTESGLRAITHFLAFHQRRSAGVPPPAAQPPAETVERWLPRLQSAPRALDPAEALALLADFGLAAAPSVFVESAGGAVAAAARLGYPVVLKAAVPGLLHKTEADGVVIGLGHPASVAAAYVDLERRCGPRVQVQAQVGPGVEVLLGMVRDDQFGPVLTIGIGGVLVEAIGDVVTLLPPVAVADARAALRRLRGYGLLAGVRGRPPAAVDSLAAMVASFSILCAALGEQLVEVDLNPVIVTSESAVAVDALVVCRASA